MKHFRNRQRGDTIVEVLICMAVLTTVLGGAYVTSNRNTLSNRASQERLEAVKLAEGQVERLRIYSREDASVFTRSTPFCLIPSGTNQLDATSDNNAACYVSSAGAQVDASVTPRYHTSVQKTADVSTAGVTGSRYTVTITWANVSGNGNDSLETLYEVYR